MMNLDPVSFAFGAFNLLRLASYFPQIVAVARDRHGATAISFSCWSIWIGANTSTALYAWIKIGDLNLALISAFILTKPTSDLEKTKSAGVGHEASLPALKGFRAGKKEDKLGWRASDTAELIMEDVMVPEENRLGDEGAGFVNFMKTLDNGRVGIAALSLAGTHIHGFSHHGARCAGAGSGSGRPSRGTRMKWSVNRAWAEGASTFGI